MFRSNRSMSLTMISYGLSLILVIIATDGIMSTAVGSCNGVCGQTTLPYPFGFSLGCPIRFECSGGVAKIGEFSVKNVTDESVFVGIPINCSRSIEKLKPLFGELHAPTSENSFLVEHCGDTLEDSCSIKRKFLESQLKLQSCDSNGNLSCFSLDTNITKFFTFEDLRQTRCRSLFSSIAFESVGENSAIALEFERVRLGWWLLGRCGNGTCSEGANCNDVNTADGEHGHRCSCPEGYIGDGFSNGSPCRRHCHGFRLAMRHCKGAKFGIIIGGTVTGASLMAVLALLLFCIRRRSISTRNLTSAKRLLSEAAGNSSIPFFPYKEIEKATSGFSDKQRLGTGAYGTVYAGKLQNDEWVAIKRLRHRDSDSIDQVMNEIKLLSSVSHPNLVRLLGCCIEQGDPVLVYEFMPNGTLSQHLQRERGNGLPWTMRLTIATQTAKAIAYLHSSMNPPIYHRDIKSSNILLDYDFNSKVADFGLSRLGLTESSHISTAPQGTPGYLDPQYHQCFHLSDKSDVYSFGVVLVEIITALKVVDFNRPHSEINLAALAIDKIGSGCIDEIIDPIIEPNLDAWTLSSIHSMAELAFRCLAFHRDMRPTMMEVADELEQIRLSAWIPNMAVGVDSPAVSQHSSDFGSERSTRKSSIGSRRSLLVPQKPSDSLVSMEEIQDSSPVSVQDPWLSDQSSPSANSLLGNMPR
ncbi:PREDICTED: wall-associated receptor kinase-like 14 isoform X2 [Tarenaya hassleriana]|uniref:wall-associated receptor kinase-like 14 isoform X2 n=1 Tax=Tarenaya hassleriana TaxID=28532 RepID=UPI00053C22A1|nr:PREDICTED: wall-associated receptor kinase-like 14 isoform X2 [Tarenaya hassleriana]